MLAAWMRYHPVLKAIREAIILLVILFTFYSSPELLYPYTHISNWWNQNDMICAKYPLATFNSFIIFICH